MKKQFTPEDILNGKGIYYYNNDVLYLIDDSDNAYGFSKGSAEWTLKEDFWDYFESSLMMSFFQPISREEAAELYRTWTGDKSSRTLKLNDAIVYAVEHHSGQFRKGTLRPYIMHPLESMQILASMNADLELLMAGVLHDTIEDTDATEEEIRSLFGDSVADLVLSHSEDKSKSWDERKRHTIEELFGADKRLKMLVMSDKLSNLRSMAADYAAIGDELWNRFNAPRSKQAWYYSGIQDALHDMQNYPECSGAYWEMVELFKDLFVSYYFDRTNEIIYQISSDGEGYMLSKGDPFWKPMDGSSPGGDCERIDRRTAESMEDSWNSQIA